MRIYDGELAYVERTDPNRFEVRDVNSDDVLASGTRTEVISDMIEAAQQSLSIVAMLRTLDEESQ